MPTKTDYLISAQATTQGVDQLKAKLEELAQTANQLGFANSKVSASFKNGNTVISGSAKQTSGAIGEISTSIKTVNTAQKEGVSYSEDFTRALKRVLVVVPLWATARFVIQQFTETLKAGVQSIIKFDEELLRVRNTLMGVTEPTRIIEELRKEVEDLSIKSGISVDKLANSFYKFSTIGNTVEDSFAGMNSAMITAKALQGDVTEIAEIQAMIYKLLGKTLDQHLTKEQQLLSIGAKLNALYHDNKFEIKDMNDSFRAFIPVANVANISFDKTAALLATLNSGALKASQAGTLLRTTFVKLIENLDEVAPELGVFRSETDDTADVLLKVVKRLSELKAESQGIPASLKKTSEIFGGVRGMLPTAALTALWETLDRNIKRVNTTTEGTLNLNNQLIKRYEEVESSVSDLVKQNDNLKSAIGRAFLEGLLGAKNFEDALQNINTALKTMREVARAGGEVIRFALPIIFKTKIQPFKKEDIQASLNKLKKDLQTNGQNLFLDIFSGITGIKFPKIKVIIDKDNIKKETKEAKDTIEKHQPEAKIPVSIDLGADFYEKLSKLQTEAKEVIGSTQGLEAVEAEEGKLIALVERRLKFYNESEERQKAGLPILKEQEVFAKILVGDYQGIADITKGNVFNKTTLLEIAKQMNSVIDKQAAKEKEILALSDSIRKAKLEALGYNSLDIAKAEVNYLITQRGLSEDNIEVLKARNQVELERLKILTDQNSKVRGIFASATREALDTGKISDFVDNFREGLRGAVLDAVAEGFSNQVLQATGLDEMLGGNLASLKMAEAFETGGTNAALKIQQALSQGVGGGKIGGGVGAGSVGIGALAGIPFGQQKTANIIGMGNVPVAPADYYKTQGDAPGKNLFSMQSLQQLMGIGLMGYSLFGGGKGSQNVSQAYATAPGSRDFAEATTRSTTIAKVTNITIAPSFTLDGASLNDKKTIQDSAQKLITIVKDQVIDILQKENVTLGN